MLLVSGDWGIMFFNNSTILFNNSELLLSIRRFEIKLKISLSEIEGFESNGVLFDEKS